MFRNVVNQFVEWKKSDERKPLVVLGARQVGKTYSLLEFGKLYYKNVAYINCDENEQAKSLFAQDFNVERVLLAISAITKVPIVPGDTLIILDEIQELQRGLNSLKYFCENAPEYHVCVAGSLLGITLQHGTSFPVGKVDIIKMYPMTFSEFLIARGQDLIAMAEIDPALLILPNEMKKGKGMLTENFVCTQLAAIIEQSIFYYSKENSPLEIDFMIQDGSRIVPIEVKSEENLKSKSLSAFLGQNANAHGIRFSMSPYREQERMTNVPLYGAGVYFGRG